MAGVIVSRRFVPQYFEIHKVGDSATISWMTQFIACVCNHAQLVNSFILTFYDRCCFCAPARRVLRRLRAPALNSFKCCANEWSRWDCVVNTMGFSQFVFQAAFNFPVYASNQLVVRIWMSVAVS